MTTITKILACAVTFMASGTMAALAVPGAHMSQQIAADTKTSDQIEQARYHGYGGYRGGRHGSYGRHGYSRHSGRNIGIGIGAAVIGGIILNEAARAEHQSSSGDAWERCASTYRSFEPSTGMYTGYDGVRRTCPYLD